MFFLFMCLLVWWRGRGLAYALFTRISTALNSSGSWPTKAETSSGLDTSSFTGCTFTPFAKPLISWSTSFSVSIRRAVMTSFNCSGCVRANSMATALPMPELAPVMTTVLPLSLCATDDDILACCCSKGERLECPSELRKSAEVVRRKRVVLREKRGMRRVVGGQLEGFKTAYTRYYRGVLVGIEWDWWA